MGKNRKSNPDTSKPIWDALLGLSAAVGQVNSLPSMLTPFVTDKELVAKISDRERFYRLVGTLDRDLRQMTGRYRSIYERHSNRHGGSADSTEWMQAIDLHELYVAWAADFDDVVIPTFMDIMKLFVEAGADTSGVHVPSASAAAQQFSN